MPRARRACSQREQRAFLCRYLADFCDYAARGPGRFRAVRPGPARAGGAVRPAGGQPPGLPRLTLLSDSGRARPRLGCTSQRVSVDTPHHRSLRIPLAWGTGQT